MVTSPPSVSVSRRNSRTQSTRTPPQSTSPVSTTTLGESIFQSLSFKPMGLADVLETHDGSETPRPHVSRRRVTSPDTVHPFPLPPAPAPPPDSLPRKHRSALRLSRLRSGVQEPNTTVPMQRTASRQPGSAGGVPPTQPMENKRGMRVRASSELTRPTIPFAVTTLAPVPVSPGVASTWSNHSEESALADDSDVDAPTTPSLTTSRSNSDAPADLRFPTPKPSMSNLDSDILDPARQQPTTREQHSKFFTLKGPSKERCHAFSPRDAPYPISYSHKILDHYNLEVDLSLRTVVGLTFHKLSTPPAKVLDLGCGTGYWIVKAAHQWTHTEFVGFDLVPIQPCLERVASRSGLSTSKGHADLRLHERIRWVHGNFLETLPFQDNEFDFVRCRKIARGVPELKWEGLYNEIVRVMKPGAAFEHIEEDIIFPTEISHKPTNPPVVAVYPTARAAPTPPYLSSPSLPPSSSSIVRTPDQYRRSPSTSFSSVIESPVEGRNGVPSVSSTSSLIGSNEARTRTTLVVPGSATSTSPSVSDVPYRDSRGSNESNGHGRHQAADYSFHDPRVHNRLEDLFVSMHDARWINLKPLSLLPRLIQERMTGMVSSPPLNMYLPPRPREAPIPNISVGAIEIARASGEVLIKQLSKMRASERGPEFDESLLTPRAGDDEIARFMTFDFSRMGSVAKGGGAGIMPTGQFKFDLGWLAFHLSTAANEVLACKEAIWEHLKELEPEADRREFDALVRQYQTDMQDRVGLSSKLRDKLHWGPPESDFMKTPEQRVFEENYAQATARDVQQGDAPKPPRVERLRHQLSLVQHNQAFLLHAGDCAESFEACTEQNIRHKLGLILSFSLIMIWGMRLPVVRIGRIAGQYAKPRSSGTEKVEMDDGQGGKCIKEIPSFRGDNVNGLSPYDRTPCPQRLERAYFHSAATLCYLRSLLTSGFASLSHPRDWSLGHENHLANHILCVFRDEFERISEGLSDALDFCRTVGANEAGGGFESGGGRGVLGEVDFYTSHEGLMLEYEEAMTRILPLPPNLRAPSLDGTPSPTSGSQVGPSMHHDELVRLLDIVNPDREDGKVTLITRYGASKIEQFLPGHISSVQASGHPVIWICDPMHGNTLTSSTGHKTRHFSTIISEITSCIQIHSSHSPPSRLGGISLEFTGELNEEGYSVTECLGGSMELKESELSLRYQTFCDPRLNFEQSLDVAFLISNHFKREQSGRGRSEKGRDVLLRELSMQR
ncbi:unnamed protein product [Rhizoctonia solani]|nr:unnamed protein product [Rhizoctonia solani]